MVKVGIRLSFSLPSFFKMETFLWPINFSCNWKLVSFLVLHWLLFNNVTPMHTRAHGSVLFSWTGVARVHLLRSVVLHTSSTLIGSLYTFQGTLDCKKDPNDVLELYIKVVTIHWLRCFPISTSTFGSFVWPSQSYLSSGMRILVSQTRRFTSVAPPSSKLWRPPWV